MTLVWRPGYTWWDPSLISTALWLDAADASTITTSGSEVTQIDDKSGNGRNFTGTSGSRPTTGTATQNSKNVLSFSAAYLTSASSASTWTLLNDGTGSSLFSVVRFGVSADPNASYALVGSNGGTSSNIGYNAFFDDRSSLSRNNRFLAQVSNGAGGTSGNVVLAISDDNAIAPNTHKIVSHVCNTTTSTAANRSEIRIDAASPIKANTFANAVSSSAPTYTLQIGASGSNSQALTGELAEIIIVSGIAPTNTRQRIEGYLAHKWGLTANLPSDHPYRWMPPTPGV